MAVNSDCQAFYQMSTIDTHYVSEIDQTLREFDQTHPKSCAQQAEFDKYQRIYQQRDVPTEKITQDDIWE